MLTFLLYVNLPARSDSVVSNKFLTSFFSISFLPTGFLSVVSALVFKTTGSSSTASSSISFHIVELEKDVVLPLRSPLRYSTKYVLNFSSYLINLTFTVSSLLDTYTVILLSSLNIINFLT